MFDGFHAEIPFVGASGFRAAGSSGALYQLIFYDIKGPFYHKKIRKMAEIAPSPNSFYHGLDKI